MLAGSGICCTAYCNMKVGLAANMRLASLKTCSPPGIKVCVCPAMGWHRHKSHLQRFQQQSHLQPGRHYCRRLLDPQGYAVVLSIRFSQKQAHSFIVGGVSHLQICPADIACSSGEALSMQNPLISWDANLLQSCKAGAKAPVCPAGRQWNLLKSLLEHNIGAGIFQDLPPSAPSLCLCRALVPCRPASPATRL